MVKKKNGIILNVCMLAEGLKLVRRKFIRTFIFEPLYISTMARANYFSFAACKFDNNISFGSLYNAVIFQCNILFLRRNSSLQIYMRT